MLIDCDCCAMKGTAACDDCVVTVMLAGDGSAGVPIEVSAEEEAALAALADAGLVPRLRLAPEPPHTAAG